MGVCVVRLLGVGRRSFWAVRRRGPCVCVRGGKMLVCVTAWAVYVCTCAGCAGLVCVSPRRGPSGYVYAAMAPERRARVRVCRCGPRGGVCAAVAPVSMQGCGESGRECVAQRAGGGAWRGSSDEWCGRVRRGVVWVQIP